MYPVTECLHAAGELNAVLDDSSGGASILEPAFVYVHMYKTRRSHQCKLHLVGLVEFVEMGGSATAVLRSRRAHPFAASPVSMSARVTFFMRSSVISLAQSFQLE